MKDTIMKDTIIIALLSVITLCIVTEHFKVGGISEKEKESQLFRDLALPSDRKNWTYDNEIRFW